MNRRHFITATLPSLGMLLATNRLALASMQEIATPVGTEQSKPEIELHDYTNEEALYLGALLTWLEMLEDSLDVMYEGIDAMEEDPESGEAQAMMLMPLGVWKHLSLDAQKFEGPLAFSLVHHYTVSALMQLDSAAEIISTGVVASSGTAITLGTEHIHMASDEIGKLMDALPFKRPRREEFFD